MVQWLRQRFQCRGHGFDPWSGTNIPHAMWRLGLLWSNPASVVGQAESRCLGRGRWSRNPSALLQKTVTIHTTASLHLSPEAGREELETENRELDSCETANALTGPQSCGG